MLTKTLLETKQDVPDFLQQYIPEGYEEGTDLKFEVDSDAGDGNAEGFGATTADAGDTSHGGGEWNASTESVPTSTAAGAAWNAFGGNESEAKASIPEIKVAPSAAASASVGGWNQPEPVAYVASRIMKPAATPAAAPIAKVAPVLKATPAPPASASGWDVSSNDGWGAGGGESSW